MTKLSSRPVFGRSVEGLRSWNLEPARFEWFGHRFEVERIVVYGQVHRIAEVRPGVDQQKRLGIEPKTRAKHRRLLGFIGTVKITDYNEATTNPAILFRIRDYPRRGVAGVPWLLSREPQLILPAQKKGQRTAGWATKSKVAKGRKLRGSFKWGPNARLVIGPSIERVPIGNPNFPGFRTDDIYLESIRPLKGEIHLVAEIVLLGRSVNIDEPDATRKGFMGLGGGIEEGQGSGLDLIAGLRRRYRG